MTLNTQLSLAHFFIDKILEDFSAAALVSTEGELLVSRPQSLADLGTLPASAMTCHKYFQIQPGDVILMNDPYSGGHLLSSMNLVTGVTFDPFNPQRKAPGTSDALLVVRTPFQPRVKNTTTVEEEGLRLPPTPLMQGWRLNEDLLMKIGQHPLAPEGFSPGIQSSLENLQKASEKITKMRGITKLNLNKKNLKEWLHLSQMRFQNILSELAVGSARLDLPIGENSRIVLSLEIRNQKVSFNFTGSGAPYPYALSEDATLGTCAGALVAALNTDIPINAGVLRTLELIAPLGSIVHARYPAPMSLGLTDGTALIANLVLKLLGQIDSRFLTAQHGMGQCSFQINFQNQRYFYDDLAPGKGASSTHHGVHGLDVWRRNYLQNSIENIERLYPLRVRLSSFRSHSGGGGQLPGGNGQTKIFEVLAPALLTWKFSKTVMKPEGLKGGKSALGSEIWLYRKGKIKEQLSECGDLELEPEDQILIHSAGGGGYGL